MKAILDITKMTRMEQHVHCTVAYSLLHGLLELAPHEVVSRFPDMERVLEHMAVIYKSIQLNRKFSAGAEKRIRACLAEVNEHNMDTDMTIEEQCRAFSVWWCALLYFWLDAVKFAPQWTCKAEAEWQAVKRWIFKTSDELAARYGERVDTEGMGLYFRGYMALGHPRTPTIKWYLEEMERPD